MRKYLWLIIFFSFISTGCSTLESKNSKLSSEDGNSGTRNPDLHMLYIDQQGRLLNPKAETLVTKDQTEESYLDQIFVEMTKIQSGQAENIDGCPNIPASSITELMIFVHGGLNTFSDASKRVKEDACKVLEDGKYPIYIAWNSGPLTNYKDHLFFMRRGNWAELLGPLSFPAVFLEDTARAITRLPAAWYYVATSQIKVLPWVKSEDEALAEQGLLMKGEGYKNINNSENDRGHTIADYWSILNPVRLVTAPFVDGLGKGAWNSMLRRTDYVLYKPMFNEGKDKSYIVGSQKTAASRFFERLALRTSEQLKRAEKRKNTSYYEENSTDWRWNIDLIGHSMGAFVVNRILADYGDKLPIQSVVHMAAACPIKDVQMTVVPFLKSSKIKAKSLKAKDWPIPEYYALTLNPYRDMSEQNTIADFVPRGSLLMWIDLMFGDINSAEDKVAGFWFNLIRSAGVTFPEAVREQVTLTQFGISDGSPEKHGHFSGKDGKHEFWLKEFWNGKHDAR